MCTHLCSHECSIIVYRLLGWMEWYNITLEKTILNGVRFMQVTIVNKMKDNKFSLIIYTYKIKKKTIWITLNDLGTYDNKI